MEARDPSLSNLVEEEVYKQLFNNITVVKICIFVMKTFMVACKVSMSQTGYKDMSKEMM
jgi:hypothetical protein